METPDADPDLAAGLALPSVRPAWAEPARMIAGLVACLLVAWISLARGDPVPLLTLVTLGFHELGHLVTYPFPATFTAAMGTVTQVLVPLGLAAYFTWRHKDRLGVALCLAWAASAAQEGSVYIADAPYQRLPLLGGGIHDWAFVLGRLHALGAAATIARVVLVFGWICGLAAIAICAYGLIPRPVKTQPAAAPPGTVTVRPISWE